MQAVDFLVQADVELVEKLLADLEQIQSTTFWFVLRPMETGLVDNVIIESTDIRFAVGALKAMRAAILLFKSYNLDLDVTARKLDQYQGSLKNALDGNPDFLRPAAQDNPVERELARVLLLEAADVYLSIEANLWERRPSPSGQYLFDIWEVEELGAEVRAELLDGLFNFTESLIEPVPVVNVYPELRADYRRSLVTFSPLFDPTPVDIRTLESAVDIGNLFDDWWRLNLGNEELKSGEDWLMANGFLSFMDPVPPELISITAGGTIAVGESLRLEVEAEGAAFFQWYWGETGDTSSPIPDFVGGGGPSLEVFPASTTSYWVQVTSADGSHVNSRTITVRVNVPEELEFKFERSNDLQGWERVPVTAEMLSGEGTIFLSESAGKGFYRLQILARESTPTPEPKGMVLVEGGTLQNDNGLNGIVVITFEISRYEVTWGEWKEVRTYAAANGYDIGSRGQGCADDHPVRSVSWYDVVKWCNAKSEMEGLIPVYAVSGGVYRTGETNPGQNLLATGYRLPLEAEWEFAARGGNRSNGYTYAGSNDLNEVGWYVDNSAGAECDYLEDRATWPVGKKASNELGLYDMSGNVWEWCWDPSGSNRRIRGGSWLSVASRAAVSNRYNDSPDIRLSSDGFRPARSSGN
jgi:formylglycine-generating enzyme